ncbi:virion structural protein [Ralstonia phage RSL2]|uniref:virion structural protein n=1 Tax=Ralstonia phage RSL2 TaxID=1585840 RepID=UPI00054A85B6|nr:virion structural protein [Ralstonia phage RSL2]
MADTTTVAVPQTPIPWGTDGVLPIKNWDVAPLWKTWAKSEVFLGGDAAGRYIPKINDYVEDTDYGITYKVTALSDLWVPTLVRVTPKPIADMDSEDVLLGQTKDAFRCFIDKTSKPFRLQVDARCYVNARNASTARVYRGNPINGVEEIVSLVLDQSGQPIGTQIPLQLGVMPNGINKAQYYIPTAYTNTDIANGEFLYVVLFDDTGAPLSSKELRAQVTSFTASTDQSIAAVTGIALQGPLVSKLVPNRLEVPLNLTLNSMNLMGLVSYNSGGTKQYNVDGTRFELLGMREFAPTQAGEHATFKLKYNLLGGEVSYQGGAVGTNRFIMQDVDVVVVDVENQLSVKLYPYPVWQDPINGYRLRWFMLNLDRNICYDVTGIVELGANSPAFSPTLYGVKQQLTMAIDLSKVNGSWRAYRFVQTVGITLLRAGQNFDGVSTLWKIAFDPNQTPEYGDTNVVKSKFINQNLCEVNMQSGYGSLENWLTAFYYNTRPLTDPQLESDAPVPDHVIFSDGGTTNSIRLAIADYWNAKFTVNFPVLQDQTWFLKFVKQGPTDDIVLGQAGVPIQQVSTW